MAASEPAARGRHGLSGAALALPLACVAVLVLLAWQVLAAGPVTRLDGALTLYLAERRAPWLTAFMLAVANGHDTVRLLAATGLLAAWQAWRRRTRDLVLLAAVPTGMLLNVGLKNLFQRARPVLDAPLVHLGTYSFPSGHAVASTVFYGVLCALVLRHARTRAARGLAAAAAVAMVLLVCFSRLYLGAHYLSDVVAGVCVGLLWLQPFLRRSARRGAAAA